MVIRTSKPAANPVGGPPARFVGERKRAVFLLLAVTAGLLTLRLWHLRADFPAWHFYSQERAEFTDEGFYTSAALHHFTLGHAYLPGGWNPGVFMPVWPLMVGLLFHFTGVSAVAARALAVLCTGLGVLLAYAVARQYRSHLFAAVAALLVSANALGFFYGRLALLEPALGMLVLLAMYLAATVQPGNYFRAVAVGVVFTLAALTKTSAPFLLPAVLCPIWFHNAGRSGAAPYCVAEDCVAENRLAAFKLLATALGTVVLLLGLARLVWIDHYAADSHVILYMRPLWQLENSPLRLLRFFFRGTWIDPVLFPLAVACVAAAVWRLRSLWRDPLFVLAFLWSAGYAAFIVFHYDGPPRYFVTLIVPTIWLAMIFCERLWRSHRRIGMAVAASIAVSAACNVASIGDYLLHPRYTLSDASIALRQRIAASQSGPPALLIGRGAEEVSLLSGGLPAIDSDGVMPLAQKLDVYHPGWFMRWTSDPPLRASIVQEHRRMVERAAFSGLDPNRGATLVLYQLYPRVAR